MINTHFSTKDALEEGLACLGVVLIVLTLILSPSIYKALKTPPKPKLGHSTAFGIKPTNNPTKH